MLLAVLLPTVAAQDPAAPADATLPAVKVLPLTAASGLQLSPPGQRPVRQVTWTPAGGAAIAIPLARPVQDLEAAVTPAGDLLVLLAGGVRAEESLDVYLVPAGPLPPTAAEEAPPAFYCYETRGGRRLGDTFGNGRGSWPVADGDRVQLFAYSLQGRIEFRAIDPRGRLHLVRSFDSATRCSGFRAADDPTRNEVRVLFDGVPAVSATFPHPDAPRLEVDETHLDFGRVTVGRQALRQLRLRNTGKRLLYVEVRAPAPFGLGPGESMRALPPGEETSAVIVFAPVAASAVTERLQLLSNTSNRSQTLVMRGEGLAAVTPPVTPAVVANEVAAPPAQPPAQLPPETPVLQICQVGLPSDGAVVVDGIAVAARGAVVRLHSSAGAEAVVPLRDGGAFRARIAAAAGEQLTLAAGDASGRFSAAAELGVVLPALSADARTLQLRGPAAADFELCAVLGGSGGAPLQVLARWRGQLSPVGEASVPLALLPAASDLRYVAELTIQGRRLRSNFVATR
jgi:hypothetical protein